MTLRSASVTDPPDELGAVDGLAQLSFVVHGLLERRAAEHSLSLIQTRLLGILRDRQPTINELATLLVPVGSSTAPSDAASWRASGRPPTDAQSWSVSPTPADRSSMKPRAASKPMS
jgi:hypothetical protein